MKRLILSLALSLLALPALAQSLPPQLKPQAMIDGDLVKVGDLWDNAGDRAERVIAPAPVPGKRITADARWLQAVAEAHGVDWRPANMFDRVVIERTGQLVDIKLIETELKEALALEGVSGNFDFEISNRQTLVLMVPGSGGPVNIAVRDVVWDARNARFQAMVEMPAGSPQALRQKITGRVFPVTKLPVLTRTFGRGEVISEKDVEWLEVRDDMARRDVAQDVSQLIGQEPRYQVRARMPVRLAELQRPIMVQRGSLVTVSVRTPFMTLTTQGRAMEDGGKGDVIRISNAQSKRTIEAIIDGPGTAVVGAAQPAPRLAQAR